jgi:hypothetical protein
MQFAYQGLKGPEAGEDWTEWYSRLSAWRKEQLLRVGYNDALYQLPEFAWIRSDFVQVQTMVEDRYLFNPETGEYTVARYLEDLETRYGGVDSVLIWPTYPNIGADNRNQHQMLRAMPGGLEGVRALVADFHRHNVKVYFPVMPWDLGTEETGESYWQILAQDLAFIGADGLNGDTLAGVPRLFLEAAQQQGHALVSEPELGVASDEGLACNLLGWGYWWPYKFEPVVSRAKWLEPRHKVHVCNRWARDRSDDLQNAFFNGAGYQSWENIWSIWNGITPRDGEALRRIAEIERFFSLLLTGPDWQPYIPMLQHGVFASKFATDQQSLWTIINRHEYSVAGPQLSLSYQENWRYFDVWHGVELTPAYLKDGFATFDFDLEAKGYGAFLAIEEGAINNKFDSFLEQMAELARLPLSDFSNVWKPLPQEVVEIRPTDPTETTPPGMCFVPGADHYYFQVSGIEIEGENQVGVDVQYPWEDVPRRHHAHWLAIASFYIDRSPVTNADFKAFLDATGYHSEDDYNFLKNWPGREYPVGWENKPVTWVALEDARAYAAWAGKRLPHEWEWQYAAQGLDQRMYPWGNDWRPEFVPPPEKGRSRRAPDEVGLFPEAASPFGVLDLVGQVWQWTDEYRDEHTRAAILRGGSYYYPQGSHWYFPNTCKLTEHGKYLLMAAGRDRSSTIGFRCVKDAKAG